MTRTIIPIVVAESLIPKGPYCYERLEPSSDENGSLIFKSVKPCPFRSINEDFVDESGSIQMAGYCSYLKLGDWMDNGTMLLFDAVKECGIKDDYDEWLDDMEAAELAQKSQTTAL